ncbi:MAG TPA: hypothetical protein VGG61_00040 [Gemmataceae bacterium]|jgi:hypothetical protein
MSLIGIHRPRSRFLRVGNQKKAWDATLDKTVLVAVAGLDSEARREGSDFVYMTCREDCARSLKTAFEGEIELGKRMGLS